MIEFSPEEPTKAIHRAMDAAGAQAESLQVLITQMTGQAYAPPAAEAIGGSYAGASVFIFQLLMGLALTNGTYLFFSGTGGGLRPWNSYSLLDELSYIVLVAAAVIRIFDFTAAMQFNYKRFYPFRGGAALFMADSFFGIATTLLFYVLSLTLAYNHFDALAYLYVFGAILVLDSCSLTMNLIFSRYHKIRYLLEMLLNFVAIAAGISLWYFNAPSWELYTFLVVAAQVLVDYFLIGDIVLAMRGLREARKEADDFGKLREQELQNLRTQLENVEATKSDLERYYRQYQELMDSMGGMLG